MNSAQYWEKREGTKNLLTMQLLRRLSKATSKTLDEYQNFVKTTYNGDYGAIIAKLNANTTFKDDEKKYLEKVLRAGRNDAFLKTYLAHELKSAVTDTVTVGKVASALLASHNTHFDGYRHENPFNFLSSVTQGAINNINITKLSQTRLFKSIPNLAGIATDKITDGMMNGRAIETIAKDIAGEKNEFLWQAQRIVRTETAKAYSEASILTAKMGGITNYQFLATLDEHTSEICGALDGRIFKIEDAQIGVNMPPMHPNCRCTILEILEPESEEEEEMLNNQRRFVRSEDGAATVPYKTYGEWMQENKDLTPEQKTAVRQMVWGEVKKEPPVIDSKEFAKMNLFTAELHKIVEQGEIFKLDDAELNILGKERAAALAEYAKLDYSNNSELQERVRDNLIVAERISDGIYGTTINTDTQDKHSYDKHPKGASYLAKGVNAQDLLAKYAGTGLIKDNKEFIVTNNPIGYAVNNKGEVTEVTNFVIHHSKNRTHIVPTKRNERP